LNSVKKYAEINKEEEKTLTSWRKPIVLLKKKNKVISELVAPGLHRVGVMLPYTGIQVMIFENLNESALIMTSGNKPGLPMAINNSRSFDELEGLADYFLLHNREIVNRIDDSVLRIING
jgi:hydrogenase maturation protein HypF